MVLLHRYLWSNSKLKSCLFIFYENAYIPTGREELRSPFGTQRQARPSKRDFDFYRARDKNRAPENWTKQEHYASVINYDDVEFRTLVHQNETNFDDRLIRFAMAP